jgi:hypothetical protein
MCLTFVPFSYGKCVTSDIFDTKKLITNSKTVKRRKVKGKAIPVTGRGGP